MKVLITGGAGFIGSHVTDYLLKRGDQVICVDNFSDYYSPVQKEKNVAPFLVQDTYTLYRIGIENMRELVNIFEKEKPDTIIHLAARVGVRPSIAEPIEYLHVNTMGTVNILELARLYDIQNVVYASSSSVYGNSDTVPFREDAKVDNPISPYAATKKSGELLCYTYSHLYDLNVSCLRFFTVYGPKGRPDMAPYKFVQAVHEGTELTRFGKGDTRRDYTYIDDIVGGVIAALDTPHRYEIFNLGNSHTVELNEFIVIVEELLGKKAKIKELPNQPGDVALTNADITKAQKMLGYTPKTSFKKGMEAFVEWYEKERAIS